MIGSCEVSHAKGRTRLLALVAALCAGACGAHPELPERPRLVVLYATCSLNRAYLEPYGAARPTPAFARFADEGLVFDRHHTEAGQSGIAFASLFSGTQAWRHGAYYHPTLLSDDLTLVTEAFAEDGWETWFWSGQGMGGAKLNYGQGVPPEHVFRRRKDDHAGLTANDADFEALLAGLAADPTRRAYVQVNFTLTHHAYAKHIPAADLPRVTAEIATELGLSLAELEETLALYDANRLDLQWDYPRTVARLGLEARDEERLAQVLEAFYAHAVAGLDEWFGRFLDRIDAHGLGEESLLAFTSDHGETLARPTALFRWGHGLQLAPEVIGVPLVVRGPGIEPGRYGGVTRSIDVFPTLAGLAGVPLEALEHTWDGTDLSLAVRGERAPPEQVAFSHTAIISPAQMEKQAAFELRDRYFPDSDPAHMWTAMRVGDVYYVLRKLDTSDWGLQVFDLAADPGLEHDLFDADDPRHEEATNRLSSYRARLIEGYLRVLQEPGHELPLKEQLRRLRELGYVK